jgi:hypothetical protein
MMNLMSGHALSRRTAADRLTVGRLSGLAPEEADRGEKALWLTGGGFRAALFHLGALTRLNELGLLARIGTVGAVGGGSILGALLATRVPWPLHGAFRDWPEQVAEPLREISRRNVRARSLLRRPLGGGDAREERYARELTGELGGESSWGPRFVFGDSGLTLSGLAAGCEACLEWTLEMPVGGGYDELLVAETIAAVRTDLDAFGEAEQAVLENHGYLLADAALRRNGVAVAARIEPRPPLPPHTRWIDPERVRAGLGASSGRRPIGRLRPRRAARAEREPQPRSPQLTALLERHRPLLRYDSLEPVRADSAATICELAVPGGRCNSLHRADGSLIATAAPGAGEAKLELAFLGASSYADGRSASRRDHLDECGGSLAADALTLRRDPANADVAYGHARRAPGGSHWLQYWLFFYFADRGHLGLEQREGDWQLVQILVGRDGEPEAVTLARPGGALRLAWEEVERADGGEGPAAVVFPARGSHAPLPRAGTFAAPVVPDHNDGGGPLVRPRLEPIGDDGPGWAHWPGRWGATRRREYFEAESPRGPGRQPAWWDPAELEREAAAWEGGAAHAFAEPGAPAPRLRARREEGLAVVEYSFPELGPGQAEPARLVAAAVDAAGEPGPPQALAVAGREGAFTLQLPPDSEWSGVRVGGASAGGAPGPVAAAALGGGRGRSGGERAG